MVSTSCKLPATNSSGHQSWKQSLLMIFCLWHMFAVLVASIPPDTAKAIDDFRRTFLTLVQPYLMLTGQEQGWPLFAPDPVRRVSTYHLDVFDGGAWTEREHALDIDRFTTRELRALRKIEQLSPDRRSTIEASYTASLCKKFDLPSGKQVRIRSQSSILPTDFDRLQLSSSDLPAATERVWTESSCLDQ